MSGICILNDICTFPFSINRTGSALIVGKLAMNLNGVKPEDPLINNLLECLQSWLTQVIINTCLVSLTIRKVQNFLLKNNYFVGNCQLNNEDY